MRPSLSQVKNKNIVISYTQVHSKLSIFLSFFPSIFPSIVPSSFLSIFLYTFLSTFLSIYHTYLSIYFVLYLSIYNVYLSFNKNKVISCQHLTVNSKSYTIDNWTMIMPNVILLIVELWKCQIILLLIIVLW
jgi:hypothetical protein